MDTFEVIGLLLLALGLSAINFSTAVYTAVYRCLNWKENLIMASIMSFFQVLMILLGWLTGRVFSDYLGSYGTLTAVFIFSFLGIRLFAEYRKQNPVIKTIAKFELKLHLGFALLISINTFFAGIALGFVINVIWHQLILLFSTVFLMVIIGAMIGTKGKIRPATMAELAASILMIIVAFNILLQYLSFV